MSWIESAEICAADLPSYLLDLQLQGGFAILKLGYESQLVFVMSSCATRTKLCRMERGSCFIAVLLRFYFKILADFDISL
jgi:hypothetical protein